MSESELSKVDTRDLQWLESNPMSWGRALSDPDLNRWARQGLVEFHPAVGLRRAGYTLTNKGRAAIRKQEAGQQ